MGSAVALQATAERAHIVALDVNVASGAATKLHVVLLQISIKIESLRKLEWMFLMLKNNYNRLYANVNNEL